MGTAQHSACFQLAMFGAGGEVGGGARGRADRIRDSRETREAR